MTIRLESVRVVNCFGFIDSGIVNMRDESNLIYFLGRNSSGKTAILTAISYIESGMIPSSDPRFTNFNDTGAPSFIEAVFTVGKGDLSAAKLSEAARKKPFAKPNSDTNLSEQIVANSEYKKGVESLVKVLDTLYETFLQGVESAGKIYVRKFKGGSFWFSVDGAYKEYGVRDKAFRDAAEKAFPGSQINIGGNLRRLDFPFHLIENHLFNQFPRIVFFDTTYSLIEDLPERITAENVDADKSDEAQLLKAFIDYLDRAKVSRFLQATSPIEQRELETGFNQKLKELTDQVNRYRTSVNTPPLLGITVDRSTQGGLQVTVTTDNKESYYRQISDNTKFLFAYFLYRAVHNLQGDILLFDEPNNGFHASAQEHLLNFLQDLGRNGSLVVVSTHSEHLIDATHLSGVRLMAVDDKRYPRVENHYHSQLKGKHTGDFMALRPILDAIGLHYGSHKLLAHDRVVIVEGVADMLYLRTFGALLGYDDVPAFAPARGDNTILLLVPLFISQGIRIKVALDADKRKDNTKARLDRDYGITAQYVHEVPVPAAYSKNKGSGIEDLFSKADFRKLLEAFGATLDPDFDAVANSEYIKRPLPGGSSGPKRLVAAWFEQHRGSYKESDFEQETIDNVRAVLDFCVKDEWFSL